VNSTGTEALASGADSIAVGTNARATAANSIAVGAGSLADRANSVSIGAAGAERQVTNMAAGTAATDAVNLGQLQASEQGALRYDLNGDGSVNYASATLGQAAPPPRCATSARARSAPPAARPSTVPSCLRPTRPWPPTSEVARRSTPAAC
jgi:hypothetical protein